MTARTPFLQASALHTSRSTHSILERPIIIDIYDAHISHCPSFSCCFHCRSRFRCSYPVCYHLHICDGPADPPILNSYLKARSEDGGTALSARDSHDGCAESTSEKPTSQPHSGSPGEFIARDFVDDVLAAISNRKTRRSDVVERNVPRDVKPESLAARVTSEEFLDAILSDRDLSSGQDIEARSLFSDLFDVGMTVLNDFRRDVPSGELAGRDVVDDLLRTLSNRATREPNPGAPKTVARDSSTSEAFVKAFFNSRDSSMGNLAGRDVVDDYFISHMSNHATRKSTPQQETQARGVPDGAPKSVTRDSSASKAFIEALLKTRDSGREITPDDVLGIGSLASRALDELD